MGQISEPWYCGINIGLCRRQFVTSTVVFLNKIYFFLKFARIVGGFRVGPLQILVLLSTQKKFWFFGKVIFGCGLLCTVQTASRFSGDYVLWPLAGLILSLFCRIQVYSVYLIIILLFFITYRWSFSEVYGKGFFMCTFSVVQESKEFWYLFVSIHVPPSDGL
jgi:hypothetical protein